MSARGRQALTTLRRRLLGVALLMTIVLFLTATVTIYQRGFTPEVDVELRAASSGSQLLPEADVKAHGMVIGRVKEVEASESGAVLHLALEPERAKQLPSNVSARLLPMTLFGERYVSLDIPENASSEPLSSGAVIEQDRSRASVELETVLADTMPVLQAVHPDELAVTLNSLSHALEGRGRPLGETISQLNSYLDGLNPSVPELRENLRELVGVAETYSDAAPDVAEALGNLSTTARTLSEQRKSVDALTKQVTATSADTTKFLRANKDNLIRLGESQRPTLDVLAKYSPQFPCFLNELTRLIPRINKAFGAGTDEPGLHITLEVTPHRGKYVPGQDEPKFEDKRGPRCYPHAELPIPAPQYPPDGAVRDGSVPPPPARTAEEGLLPASTTSQSASSLGLPNSPAERDYVATLLAPSMGVSSDEVPGWGSLLVGPVLRGAEVSYR